MQFPRAPIFPCRPRHIYFNIPSPTPAPVPVPAPPARIGTKKLPVAGAYVYSHLYTLGGGFEVPQGLGYSTAPLFWTIFGALVVRTRTITFSPPARSLVTFNSNPPLPPLSPLLTPGPLPSLPGVPGECSLSKRSACSRERPLAAQRGCRDGRSPRCNILFRVFLFAHIRGCVFGDLANQLDCISINVHANRTHCEYRVKALPSSPRPSLFRTHELLFAAYSSLCAAPWSWRRQPEQSAKWFIGRAQGSRRFRVQVLSSFSTFLRLRVRILSLLGPLLNYQMNMRYVNVR